MRYLPLSIFFLSFSLAQVAGPTLQTPANGATDIDPTSSITLNWSNVTNVGYYELQFEIDAIDGPSIRIFPLLTEISNGEEFNVEIWAEEVVNVAAMEIVLRYDMQMLEITQENIAIGDYFSQNGGSIIDFSSIEEQGDYSEITINIGVYSGEPESVSGSGPVISITPTAIMSGITDLELLDGDIILREPDNEDIEIENAVNGVVVVQ